MSVFYHNDDPLLHQTMFQSSNMNGNNLSDTYAQMYKHQLMMEMQQQNQVRDWVGELDNTLKQLDSSTVELLNNDSDFTVLNSKLQTLIQNEIMLLVKPKINSNNDAIDNIKRQIDIIIKMNQKVKDEEKQNMNDLNDYLKNYSHLTFDEYRRLKSGNYNVDNNSEEEIIIANDKNKRNKNKV